MRAIKIKAIRKALRENLQQGPSKQWVAHPKLYVNVRHQTMLKYVFQYGLAGGKQLIKLAKKIYRKTGKLPK